MQLELAFSKGRLKEVMCLCQSLLLLLSTSCVQPGTARRTPGLHEYQAPIRIEVPGAKVNLAGGNLMIDRLDLAIDTHLGTRRVGGFYNSAMQMWTWSFQMKYNGSLFMDDTGALHDVGSLAAGDAIPGTHWVMVDDRRIKTKGGLLYTFDPQTFGLATLNWVGHSMPKLIYISRRVSASDRVVGTYQCRDTSGCQLAYQVEYDSNGCVDTLRDRAGREAIFESDRRCLVQTARDPMDVARDWQGMRYEYAGGALSAVTNSEGERVEYDYLDDRIRRVRVVGDAGEPDLVTSFRYGRDPGGGFFYTIVEHPDGGESRYGYDDRGRIVERVDPVGDLTTWVWSGLRPAARIDAAGATTSWVVVADDVVRIMLPTGNVIDMQYAPDAENRADPRARPILRVTDSLGLMQERVYGVDGSLWTMRNGAGETTQYAYDQEGSVVSVTTPAGELTQLFSYGFHGHPETTLRAGYVEHRAYDEVGNLLRGGAMNSGLAPDHPGMLGRIFDEDRNMVGFVLEGGSEANPYERGQQLILTEFRSDGRPLRIYRPYGGLEEFEYDGRGLLVRRRERVDGVLAETRVEYDGAGRQSAVELANGMRREVDRDRNGREIGVRLMRAGVVEQSLRRAFVQGRLVRVRDSAYSAGEDIVHDAAGRPVRIVFPDGEALEVGYDLRSRETLHRYLMGGSASPLRSLGFEYDGADRRIRIMDADVSVWERDVVAGRDEQIRYGNGLSQDFVYHADLGVRTASTIAKPGGQLISDAMVSWRECEPERMCVTSRTRVFDVPPNQPYSITEEGYVMGLLASGDRSVERAGMRLEGSSTFADDALLWSNGDRHAYDALGNRIGVGDAAGVRDSFIYNPERNRLIGAELESSHSYAYDAAGYMTLRDGEVLGWDAGGRLSSIGASVSLVWDADGRPVSSDVDGLQSRMRFGGRIIGDANGAPVSLELGDVRLGIASGSRVYRHRDFRGNVKLVSDEAGDIVLHRGYGPFRVESVHGVGDDDQSFAGGTEVGGLIRLGERFYDPQVGRFISPDPIRHVFNQHAYTLGNPVLLWDPDGRQAAAATHSAGIAMLGETMAFIGTGLVIGGATSGNAPMLGFGVFLNLVGVKLHVTNTPSVRGGTEGSETSTAGTLPETLELSSDLNGAGCSPSSISRRPNVDWRWLVAGIAQLLVAAWVVDRRRGWKSGSG